MGWVDSVKQVIRNVDGEYVDNVRCGNRYMDAPKEICKLLDDSSKSENDKTGYYTGRSAKAIQAIISGEADVVKSGVKSVAQHDTDESNAAYSLKIPDTGYANDTRKLISSNGSVSIDHCEMSGQYNSVSANGETHTVAIENCAFKTTTFWNGKFFGRFHLDTLGAREAFLLGAADQVVMAAAKEDTVPEYLKSVRVALLDSPAVFAEKYSGTMLYKLDANSVPVPVDNGFSQSLRIFFATASDGNMSFADNVIGKNVQIVMYQQTRIVNLLFKEKNAIANDDSKKLKTLRTEQLPIYEEILSTLKTVKTNGMTPPQREMFYMAKSLAYGQMMRLAGNTVPNMGNENEAAIKLIIAENKNAIRPWIEPGPYNRTVHGLPKMGAGAAVAEPEMGAGAAVAAPETGAQTAVAEPVKKERKKRATESAKPRVPARRRRSRTPQPAVKPKKPTSAYEMF